MKTTSFPWRELRLAELLSTLSRALDMTEGQPPGHCIRCCWIGMHIGWTIGLTDRELSDLYYTLLLKDLGCSSNAARICQLYMADDLTFKRDFKQVDGSLPQVLRFILSHTGLKAGLADRFRALVNIIQNGGEIARELIESRCHRGADIARQLHFPESVAEPILNLDEHWDGSGLPNGFSGGKIPVMSQIALMAQVVDVFHLSGGPESARSEIKNRSGIWFAPYLCHVFALVAKDKSFWTMLSSSRVDGAIFALEPANVVKLADEDYLDDVAAAFAGIVDSKSSTTAGHSERVTLYADLIAEQMGLRDDRRRSLRRAALLHDIGKLGISNSILDKNGDLDEEERKAVEMHTVYSEELLSGISVFADIAAVAGSHHERLDGLGYPRGLKGDQIGLDIRIVTTADIFDALTAARPYKSAIPVAEALAMMEADVGTAIDADCFAALKRALDKMEIPPA